MVKFEGVVQEIIYHNEINGYTVCEVKGEKDCIVAVGYMPFICAGETLKITGTWTRHPDYGEQLKVEMYEKVLPHSAEAIERYLASGIIKGVGPVTAQKIVERFGEETLDILRFDPGRLAEIKGISHDKAIYIGQSFAEQNELSEIVMFFQQYGISPTYSAKIYKVFGSDTIEKIRENPYRLADEIFGIGFKTADRIALSLGIDPMSKYRLCSGIKYVLYQAASGSGHVYLPEDKLKTHTAALLGVEVNDIEDALVALMIDRSVYVENVSRDVSETAGSGDGISGQGDDGSGRSGRSDVSSGRNDSAGGRRVYLSAYYNAETYVCRKLIELSSVQFRTELDDFEELLDRVQQEEGIELAEMQKLAVREALVNGVLVITGGPGTGKTTIIKTIIRLLEKEGYTVALAAPTGRAAKRMTEATGYEAKTIHRLLEIGYSGEDAEPVFFKNEANPIEADVVIIDETSMVDILIMNHLLKAIAPGTRLILAGDMDQLPSVGAGNVLKDIIGSGIIRTVQLTEIFRQEEESMIIVNAHRINRGERPVLNAKGKDFFFIPRSSPQSLVDTVVDLCCRRIPDSYGYDPIKQIQVLTPVRKGPAGVINLNVQLQKALNPPGREKNEIAFRDYIFREGDRVMQVKNNYNLRWEKRAGNAYADGTGVFNGDTGTIFCVDSEERRVTVVYEDDKYVDYDYSILDELEPAFAITVHKSQGSEFPVVIMPVFPGPQVLLTRNLLYTAVTRARDLVVLVGVENTIIEMINNKRETLRHSGLMEKLRRFIAEWG